LLVLLALLWMGLTWGRKPAASQELDEIEGGTRESLEQHPANCCA
jgi:hypothetical protein